MTDIRSRLIDGMRGQGIRLPDGNWLRLDEENRELIADRLLSLPSTAGYFAAALLAAAAVQAQEPK